MIYRSEDPSNVTPILPTTELIADNILVPFQQQIIQQEILQALSEPALYEFFLHQAKSGENNLSTSLARFLLTLLVYFGPRLYAEPPAQANRTYSGYSQNYQNQYWNNNQSYYGNDYDSSYYSGYAHSSASRKQNALREKQIAQNNTIIGLMEAVLLDCKEIIPLELVDSTLLVEIFYSTYQKSPFIQDMQNILLETVLGRGMLLLLLLLLLMMMMMID